MKLIMVALIFICTLSTNLLADEQVTILEVTGYGVSQNEAVRNGLVEALKQAKGVTIESQKNYEKLIHQKNTAKDGVNSQQVNINTLTEGLVKEATQGLINEYRIIESNQLNSGEWEVILAVKMLRYKTPGISPDSRRKIAIIPFRTTDSFYSFNGEAIPSSEISRQFTQDLVTELTQTRKFTVLDREYVAEFLQEKNLLLSADAPVSEQMKVGEVLGVDYLLLGTISEASFKQTPYSIQMTGETGYDNSATLQADYRIIVMATRQIKWSESIALSLENSAIKALVPNRQPEQIQNALLIEGAKQIIHKAIDNIYPLKVVKVQPGGEIILNQGGVTLAQGELLDVYADGDNVVDPYTGESLGSAESWVAKVKINRVTAKLSYATVLEGNLKSIDTGNICRRTKIKQKSQPIVRKASSVRNSANGGVILPFD